jgi:hypothetical protein
MPGATRAGLLSTAALGAEGFLEGPPRVHVRPGGAQCVLRKGRAVCVLVCMARYGTPPFAEGAWAYMCIGWAVITFAGYLSGPPRRGGVPARV